MNEIGRALRRLRRLTGMKQSHLAELAGVTQATVSRWESGTHQPTEEQARRIEPLLNARLDPAGDAALKRLVETSAAAVHLICDTSHALLAASRPRIAEWRTDPGEFEGESLWPFATDEIRRAEGMLADLGWYEPACSPVATRTGDNLAPKIRIRPGVLLWERLVLSDGRTARLVTSVAPDALPGAPGGIRLVV